MDTQIESILVPTRCVPLQELLETLFPVPEGELYEHLQQQGDECLERAVSLTFISWVAEHAAVCNDQAKTEVFRCLAKHN